MYVLTHKNLNMLLKIMLNTLGDEFPSYLTMKNWIASFKKEKLSAKVKKIPGKPISAPKNSDAVHGIILDISISN